MLVRLSFLFLILSGSSCQSQESLGLIKHWHSHDIPTNQDSLTKYNWAVIGWDVSIEGDDIHASEEKNDITAKDLPFKVTVDKEDRISAIGHVCYLKVDDGFLVGFNRGEWGGALYWFGINGKKHYKIFNDQLLQFTQTQGRIYAIQGLDHMGISEGSMITIDKIKGKWKSKNYVKLPDAPYATTIDSAGNFYVITSSRILKIDKKVKVDILVADGFWSKGLYPTSVLVKDNILYAGMRGGVLKYDIKNNKQMWLMKY